MIQTRSRLSRVVGEFLTIVLGVLVALAVDNWNVDRQEAALGRDYVERIAADIMADTLALQEALEGSPERVESGRELLGRLAGRETSDESSGGLLLSLFDAQHRYELPVADWTFSEIEGNAELRLIRDRAVRGQVVRYYARARGYRDRLLELRATLRTPVYSRLAETSFSWPTSESEGEPDLGARLVAMPGLAPQIHRVMTYELNRGTLWREWREAARQVLGTLDAAGPPSMDR